MHKNVVYCQRANESNLQIYISSMTIKQIDTFYKSSYSLSTKVMAPHKRRRSSFTSVVADNG